MADDEITGEVEPTTEPVAEPTSPEEPEAEVEPTTPTTHPVYDFGSSVAKQPEVPWAEKQRRKGENKQTRKSANK